FTFLGGDYAWSDALILRYYHAELDQLYRKDYFGFVDDRRLGPGRLKSDFRLFIAGEDGAAKAGPVDNRNTALMLTYAWASHSLGV
ncbi:OprD family porin, partial [Klebsiella pneumoniae]|nr:OprD family porin [Klebsiella pneumoniae]